MRCGSRAKSAGGPKKNHLAPLKGDTIALEYILTILQHSQKVTSKRDCVRNYYLMPKGIHSGLNSFKKVPIY